MITQVLDPEKDVEAGIIPLVESVTSEQNKFLSAEQRLDLLLLYMRRVHAYSFYEGEEYDDERMLATRCGPQHIRNA